MQKQAHFSISLVPYLLLLPQVLITLIFFVWPALQALRLSFLFEDPFGLHTRFVGLKNFSELFHSSDYLHAFCITIIFSIAVTVLALMGGLFFAVLVNRVLRGKSIYQSLLLLPYAIAPALAGMLMRFLFNPAVGVLPYWLEHWGIKWNYLVYSGQALFLVVIAAAWQQLSYNFIFYLASLQNVPRSVLEAAELDGANSWQRFWHIIFPLLGPTTFFLMIMNVLYAFFDTFAVIQIITQGGPANTTQILVYKVYQDGFMGLDFSSSAAQSVILMVIITVLTLLQFKYLEKRVHY